MDLLRLVYACDEFCREFLPQLPAYPLAQGQGPGKPEATLRLSAGMPILILCQTSGLRPVKTFSRPYGCQPLTRAFPHLVSSSRFVELEAEGLVPLAALRAPRLGRCTGIAFMDSTPSRVCPNLRSTSPKVFRGVAQRGVSRTGWFYGFTVPLVIHDHGDLLAVRFTPGTVEDRQPVPKLARRLFGKLCGERGYLSHDLCTPLWAQGVQGVTRIKKHRQNKLLPLLDKILRRKRTVVEPGNEQLKHICQLEPTRPRRLTNFTVNLLAALSAYTYQEKKPSLNFTVDELQTLPAVVF